VVLTHTHRRCEATALYPPALSIHRLVLHKEGVHARSPAADFSTAQPKSQTPGQRGELGPSARDCGGCGCTAPPPPRSPLSPVLWQCPQLPFRTGPDAVLFRARWQRALECVGVSIARSSIADSSRYAQLDSPPTGGGVRKIGSGGTMPVRPLQYALKVFNLFKRTKEDGVLPPRPHQPTLRQVS
jgi:hypothetical protein